MLGKACGSPRNSLFASYAMERRGVQLKAISALLNYVSVCLKKNFASRDERFSTCTVSSSMKRPFHFEYKALKADNYAKRFNSNWVARR